VTYPQITTDRDTESAAPMPPKPVIRYAALAGAEVHVVKSTGSYLADPYAWTCTGCLEGDGETSGLRLDNARNSAAKHAEKCRALPQLAD
jgi:hypothetical protein